MDALFEILRITAPVKDSLCLGSVTGGQIILQIIQLTTDLDDQKP
jgi:hypothetical protein